MFTIPTNCGYKTKDFVKHTEYEVNLYYILQLPLMLKDDIEMVDF